MILTVMLRFKRSTSASTHDMCVPECVCVSLSLLIWLNVKGVCLRKAEAGSVSVFVFILRAAITSCSCRPYMNKGAEQRQEQDLIGSEASVCVCVITAHSVCMCVCLYDAHAVNTKKTFINTQDPFPEGCSCTCL